MNYEEKKKLADKYFNTISGGIVWDDLPDINSLHDAETEEEIISLCNDRLEESGFPMDLIE